MAEPSDLTEWKPKRPGLSLLAKGLAGFNEYLQNDPVDVLPFGLTKPVAKGFASLISLEPAAKLLNKLAYGDNLTQGKGQTFSTAPDVFDGTMALAPPVAGLLKGMGKVAEKVPLAKDSSPSALYGGSRYPTPLDPELFMSHGTTEEKLLGYKKQLPQELYHLSQAITRNKLSQFSNPDTWLIPQYGRFEPKTDQSIITATDSYSPRYSSALGSRADEAASMAKDYARGFLTDKEYAEWRKHFVEGRLADQFGFPFEHGGIFQEGVTRDRIKSGFSRLRNFGEGTDFPFKGGKPVTNAASIIDSFNNRVMMSPRFQSLQHFEQSPYGGILIGENSGRSRLSSLENSTEKLFNALYQPHPSFTDKVQNLTYSGSKIDKLRSIASGFADPFARSEKGRKFDSTRDLFDFSSLRAPVDINANNSSEMAADATRALSSDEITQLRQTAGKILNSMKKAPSDYAEVKRYGQTKLNPDTFAGIITKSDSRELEQQALKRGLAFTRVSEYPSNSELISAADELQKAGKKGTSIYMGGMARRNPGELPEQTDFGLPSHKPTGVFNHKWLDTSFTPNNLEAAGFDYIPEGAIAHLKTFAGQTGDNELNQLVKKYESTLSGFIMEDHDIAMKALLDKVETIKSAKTSTPSAPLDPNFSEGGGVALKAKQKSALADFVADNPGQVKPTTKDWSTASWEELNGVKIAEEQAMPQTEWNAWNSAWQKAHEANKAVSPKNFNDKYAETILKHYSGTKPSYFGMEQIEAAHPELTQAQIDALSDYSWTQTSNAKKDLLEKAPHAKTPEQAWDIFLASFK